MAQVLVSDDDETNRETWLRLLREHGHDAVGFEDGSSARGWLRLSSPDIAIVQLLNPGEDGLRSVFEIHREFPDLPIIAICAPSSNASFYCLLAERMGATSGWPNPSAATLLQAIDRALAIRRPPERANVDTLPTWAGAVPA